MSILDILAGPIKGLIGGVADTADRFITTGDEKRAFELELTKLSQSFELELEKSLQAELQAKERIIVAELSQDDSYTKRARPTVVYVGLAAFVLNNVLVPNIANILGYNLPPVEFPQEFWLGWSGIVATYAVGRSMEKRAKVNGVEPGKITKLITG